jgi:GDP-L-fucose synthase
MDQVDNGDAVNLSTGIYTSFIEFARTAAMLCGYSPEVRGMSDQPAGVHARGGDTRKQAALGFKYKINFATGIKRALDYYAAARMPEHVPLAPEMPMPAETEATARKRANSR